jgi:hypothetical protein
MYAYSDEHKFVTETVMPFLQENWMISIYRNQLAISRMVA